MCLGIPGHVVELFDHTNQLAKVDVMGATREVNIGMLSQDGVQPGDWVLIHMGFAMSVIDEDEAAKALDGLRMLGSGYEDFEAPADAGRA